MKTIKLLITALLMPLLTSAQGIQFENGLRWQQVQDKAKAEHKYIFMDVFASWCGPCKQMEHEVYTQSGVGDFYNAKFICVKVQMDTSKQDNEQIKDWYADARNIKIQYQINAYPTYLFFSPDGKLVHRDLGFQKAAEFIAIGKMALDPSKQFYVQVSAWRNGKKDYSLMPGLFDTANQMNNRPVADSIARDYKQYLDLLPEVELLTKEKLDFIGRNITLVTSKDPIFNLAYNQPEKLDRVKDYKGWSAIVVNAVISREEIESKLWEKGSPKETNPDWNTFSISIKQKFPKADVGRLILNAQISFYRKMGNWRMYADLRTKRISLYPPVMDGLDAFFQLNAPAWDVFEHSMDKVALVQALKWSELSIKLKPDPNDHIQFLDTRANLLYKLGRAKEAIEQEEDAIRISNEIGKKQGKDKGPFLDDYMKILDKMKSNQATWKEK